MISMPLVEEVKIEGLTESEAEKAIGGAYNQKQLIQNPQVSVTITEARGRTFNILGGVNRPGQYAISQNDFRMLDALTVAGGDVGGGRVYVLRPPAKQLPAKEGAAAKDEAPAQPRKIRVPLDKLLAGEGKYNLVIRPGDTIVVAKAEERPMAVVVTKNGLTVDGQGTTWEGLDQTLAKLPEADRKRTVLRLVAGSEELTLGEYGRAKGRAAEIARRLGLLRVEDVGLVGGAAPAGGGEKPGGAAGNGGEYYVGGNVQRPVVYTLAPGRTVTLLQALVAAGQNVNEDRGWITLVRRGDDGAEKTVVNSVPMRDVIKAGGEGATPLSKGDTSLGAPQDRTR
jgi:protein involved in polysaccharide export with SLBB domain